MPDILILGASSDIAASCARKFASEGYAVWLAGRNVEQLKIQSADISIRYNVKSQVLLFDAVNFGSHKSFVESLPFVPDVVLLAFGYLGDQQLAETDWNESLNIINSNYTGAVSILNELANLLQKHNKGIIAGISSVAGDRGKKSNFIYGSAKAGLTVYLAGLRNRLFPHKVHVLTIKPGFVQTRMTEGMPLPKRLTAQPDAVAKDIYKAVANRKNVIYTKPLWRYLMFVISNIPESIFKKLSLG